MLLATSSVPPAGSVRLAAPLPESRAILPRPSRPVLAGIKTESAMFGAVWNESRTVLGSLLGAFFRGLARALPWTLALCMLLVAGTRLLS